VIIELLVVVATLFQLSLVQFSLFKHYKLESNYSGKNNVGICAILAEVLSQPKKAFLVY